MLKPFKITIRHALVTYDLWVTEIKCDKPNRERFRVKNYAIDITLESNRPWWRKVKRLRHRRPQWEMVGGTYDEKMIGEKCIPEIMKVIDG